MGTLIQRAGLGLAAISPLLFLECVGGSDLASIVIVLLLFAISVPWNVVVFIAMFWIFSSWPETLTSLWKVAPCTLGKAPNKIGAAANLAFMLGAFMNIQVFLWVMKSRPEKAKPRTTDDETSRDGT